MNTEHMTFELINQHGSANIILISEHASNHIPAEYDSLGLNDKQLELHIAWDIGIGELTRNLAHMLDAPAILAGFSRLLIDANRALDQDGLIPHTSDGHVISGNLDLPEQEIAERIERFYRPFHNSTDELIQSKAGSNQAPLVLNMHSFTPRINQETRHWHTGMLWNRDDRIAKALIQRLNARGFTVGDNQPYSGKHLNHTMNTHGTRHGFPHVNIEIRQDEIDHAAGLDKWNKILTEELAEIRNIPEMSQIKHY